MKIICFDMDGTIADLYGVPQWLEKLQAKDSSPYSDAVPLYDMEKMRKVLLRLTDNGWKIAVITWLAKDSTINYDKEVAKAKKEWLRKYRFPAQEIHILSYGENKADIVKSADFAIIIDDDLSVRTSWNLGPVVNPGNNLLEWLSGLN